MNDVIIVGGGIAGLATAYELHRRSVPFVLFESGSRAGGVILSEQVDGYTIDAGPDSLLVQKPDGIRLCEELGLGDRLVPTMPPRLAYIQRGGTLYPLPASSVLGIPTRFGPFLRTRLFSWAGKLRMGAEVLVPPRRDGDDESIGAFMRRRFGAEATTYLAEPLLAGIHAGDVDRLSLRALFPRFSEAERTSGSLIRAFRHQPRGRGSADGAFRSLPGGLSEMVRALVATLPARSIRLDTGVSQVHISGAISTTAAPRPGAGASWFRVDTTTGESLTVRAVVLATPAYVTARIIRNTDAELARLCEDIPYSSTATIAFAFRREAVTHPLNGSGFVVPRVEGGGILAGSWLSSKWPHRAPDDRVLLRAFAGGTRDPEAIERSDEALGALALNALRPLLGITGPPLLTRVYRWERANAQHEVGHLTRLTAIERAIAGHPGLFVTGSGFRGVGIPDCIADGRATARQLAEWLAKVPAAALP
jgi:protoporphyrinogen/coproporphyrinogen III oxidase